MAKKLTAKQKQRRLRQARKDGKITRNEAKKLAALGVNKKQITSTGKNNQIKVQKQARKAASKSKPAAKPTTSASTRKNQTPAQANPTPAPNRNNRSGRSNPSYASSGSNKDSGNKFLSGKQANQLTKLLKDPERFAPTTSSTTDRDGNVTETTTPGEINFEALANNRLVGKALRGLRADGKNINNFNSNNDLQKVLAYAQPLASKPGGNALEALGVRASGKISDIREQLGIDRQTAIELRDQFAKKGIETTDPGYKNLLTRIEKGLNSGKGEFSVPKLNRTFTGITEGELDLVNTNRYKKQLDRLNDKASNEYDEISDSVEPVDVKAILEGLGITGPQDRPEISNETTDALVDYQNLVEINSTGYEDLIETLSLQNESLGGINDQFAATNTYLTSQLSSANAAVEEANRRADNLKTAFTPGANPNAMSILAGDFRKSRRRREDNALSDLSVLTDLGTNKNQLSGLQLA